MIGSWAVYLVLRVPGATLGEVPGMAARLADFVLLTLWWLPVCFRLEAPNGDNAASLPRSSAKLCALDPRDWELESVDVLVSLLVILRDSDA